MSELTPKKPHMSTIGQHKFNYRYPETIFVFRNSIQQQIEHIQSEHEEVLKEVEDSGKQVREIEDMLHSVETLHRMLVNALTAVDIIANADVSLYSGIDTFNKNLKRGYYKDNKLTPIDYTGDVQP